MFHFHVWRIYDEQAQSYWVAASSTKEARHLVALNAPDGNRAESTGAYDCELSKLQRPKLNFIRGSLSGLIPIVQR